ncbi:hypothetical protein [Hyalangium rubrum]|uniref:Lipoprotein n=1 Tax=Hyalangium rubrum TaxID=3103134 RepID=A0ABU5HI89_9BACT|nr:hypothetical protein [Hyalangium sp. s54d21]MDY7233183.1 hypothetical protein [Hyalangium sp. s54d21]
MKALWKWAAMALAVGVMGCGNTSEHLGGECTESASCEDEELSCLFQFKGGYCGFTGCRANADCPGGSICVTEEGVNYCFRTCDEKADCNENRSSENESNCSSNVTRVESGSQKVCVPPSVG